MSWFDASGLASLAKTALKEAQKTIDKALDIKDEDLLATSATTSTVADMMLHTDKEAVPMKQPLGHSDVWGSFSGSFFDNPNTNQMRTVTTPPSSSAVKKDEKFVKSPDLLPSIHCDTMSSIKDPACESGRNSSESVEVVSPPTTPGSSLTSPGQVSCSTIQGSESVEVIDTPTSDLESPDSVALSTSVSEYNSKMGPDSVEIISDEYMDEEISLEEDSMSFDTVMESTVETSMDGRKGTAITSAPLRSTLFLSLDSSVSELLIKSGNTTAGFQDVLDAEVKVPNLLEEAMREKQPDIPCESQTQLTDSTQSFEYIQQTSMIDRSSSPNGSEERSDIVKITSDHHSGHTSADEVETTTSSDIEIISSPNGDSSSTNSACKSNADHSVDRSKKKGHCRELSEVSTHSIQSDDSRFSTQSDTEKLLRRISELSEVLEQREYKLMELGRENAELHKKSAEMKIQLESKRKRDECMEMSSVTEEYTQRMSALEKKFQQSIRERDNLRDQLKVARSDLSDKVSREAVDKEINEKIFVIQELKAEGEKLSIQILQHSNIIKKLRVKEKETDALIKKQKEEIEGFVEETERLKKSLSAKEDMERSQIEAVHKLSSEKRKLEKETGHLKSQLEDMAQKLETVQTSFDAAKKELLQKQEDVSRLNKKAETVKNLESERLIIHSQNKQMMEELSNLRKKLKQLEHGNTMREQVLRQENCELMRRLEESEMRIEEQAQGITESTIPLIRQLESLQSTLNQRSATWETQEKSFLEKLSESQRQLDKLQNIEQISKDQHQIVNKKLFNAEERLSAALLKYEQTFSLLQQKQVNFEFVESEYKNEMENLKSSNARLQEIVDDNRLRLQELQQQIDVDQELMMAEKKRHNDVETKRKISSGLPPIHDLTGERDDGQRSIDDTSPTLSAGHESLTDSLGSNVWQLDDIDCISNSGRPSGPGSIYGASGFAPVNSTSYLENLQAMLKQRDGENHQLQWELSRLQADRNFLMSEVSNLTMQLENVNEKLSTNENLEEKINKLQQQYTTLHQQHTEKTERIQELQMDLFDAKEVYKSQIDDLLRQLKEKS